MSRRLGQSGQQNRQYDTGERATAAVHSKKPRWMASQPDRSAKLRSYQLMHDGLCALTRSGLRRCGVAVAGLLAVSQASMRRLRILDPSRAGGLAGWLWQLLSAIACPNPLKQRLSALEAIAPSPLRQGGQTGRRQTTAYLRRTRGYTLKRREREEEEIQRIHNAKSQARELSKLQTKKLCQFIPRAACC